MQSEAASSGCRLRRTSASSFPASFLYALVQRTLRGFRFILKFLWHLLRQKRNTCVISSFACQKVVRCTTPAGHKEVA